MKAKRFGAALELLKITVPFKAGVGFLQDEIQILGESRQLVQNTQTDPSLKSGHRKKSRALQRIQRDFLQDLFGSLPLFHRVAGTKEQYSSQDLRRRQILIPVYGEDGDGNSVFSEGLCQTL